MMTAILVLAAVGFCISLYACFVEAKIKNDATYKPACDINDRISCSAPLRSQYSNIFYFSNSVIGMAYYLLVGILAWFALPMLLMLSTAGGVLVSLVLGYLLYFRIKSVCIVCTSLYIVNILLFLFAFGIL